MLNTERGLMDNKLFKTISQCSGGSQKEFYTTNKKYIVNSKMANIFYLKKFNTKSILCDSLVNTFTKHRLIACVLLGYDSMFSSHMLII